VPSRYSNANRRGGLVKKRGVFGGSGGAGNWEEKIIEISLSISVAVFGTASSRIEQHLCKGLKPGHQNRPGYNVDHTLHIDEKATLPGCVGWLQ